MKHMISLSDEDIEILLNGLDLLVDVKQDTINYTSLYKKLRTKDARGI